MSRWLLVLGGLLVILAVTNPSRAEFNDWAVRYTSSKIDEQARREGREASSGERVIGGAIVGLAVSALPVNRQNFIFFSIYRLDQGIIQPGSTDEGFPGCAIGIAGQFIGLKRC
jgi:hypothetical protein